MDEQKPRFRNDLEIIPARHGDEQVLIVRDPLGFLKTPAVLRQGGLDLVTLLDGTRSLADIQMALMRRRGGVLVSSDQIRSQLEQLDAAFLLDSERYRAARAEIVREFASRTACPAAHAGKSYPAAPEELVGLLDLILAENPPEHAPPAESIRGLVAPHIDFEVGAKTYAAAYGCLRNLAVDRVVILGVGHAMREALALAEKDFETPLGAVPTDRSLVGELRRAGGRAVALDDFAFRDEHSVEFQLIFLKHILGDRDFSVVPILCGPLVEMHREARRASEIEGVADLLRVLREAVESSDSRTLVLAGVDLSHVGPKFGDRLPATSIVADAERHDRALLEALRTVDADAFWSELRGVGGRYHVCGGGALACLAEILPSDASGEVLDYRTAHEEPTRSAVSFAAMVFTRE